MKIPSSVTGFGLVELVIAIAISTVLGLGLSQLMRFQVQGQNTVAANAAILNLQRTVSTAMTEYPTCHAQPFVAGLVFSTALPAASQPAVPVLTGKLTYFPSGSTIVSTVPPYNNLGDDLTITKIQIQPYSQINASTFIVQLQIVAQKALGSVYGSDTFTANIPLSVQATVVGATAQITDCTSTLLCQPPNWSAVMTSTETYCINTTSTFQPKAGIFAAAAACATQNAHLCSSVEWLSACNFAGAGFDASTPQWVAPIFGLGCGSPGCYVLATNQGYGGCIVGGNVGGDGYQNAHNFRCCHN